jgi:hypothetical protein
MGNTTRFKLDPAPCTISWCIECDGRLIIREKGRLVYVGRTADAPPEIRKLVEEFTVSFAEALPVLLGSSSEAICGGCHKPMSKCVGTTGICGLNKRLEHQ